MSTEFSHTQTEEFPHLRFLDLIRMQLYQLKSNSSKSAPWPFSCFLTRFQVFAAIHSCRYRDLWERRKARLLSSAFALWACLRHHIMLCQCLGYIFYRLYSHGGSTAAYATRWWFIIRAMAHSSISVQLNTIYTTAALRHFLHHTVGKSRTFATHILHNGELLSLLLGRKPISTGFFARQFFVRQSLAVFCVSPDSPEAIKKRK